MSGILAILEQRGKWVRMSWETVAAAQSLGAARGEPVVAAVAGHELAPLLPELAHCDIARGIAVEHELLARYTADGFTAALEQLVRSLNPSVVLLPHTYQVRDFAPALAARFDRTLIADVIAIRNEPAGPVFVRRLMQGKLNADYVPRGDGPCFVSLQAGAGLVEDMRVGQASVETFRPTLTVDRIRTRPAEPFRAAAQTVDLTAAPLIVSVGRGIQEKGNLPLVEDLADALGAELAASRPLCDNGWLPMERQVGSSGQTVAPRLYLAIGISGAIQHLVGMKGSKTVIAINKDESAPIFEVCDYGIVGDLFQVVPELTAAVRKAKAAQAG